jgi:short-subunit dehydrogenase
MRVRNIFEKHSRQPTSAIKKKTPFNMAAPTFILPDKRLTWLITGCSSGLGLALTRVIIADGRHNVIATSRNPSRTPELVAEVENAGGRWLSLDVAAPGACESLVKKLEDEGQEIDILVNNAGFAIHGAVESANDAEIKQQMDTLFFGPLSLMRAVVPYMRKRKYGVIVNMSSGASLIGTESMGIYAGAKAGLDGKKP